MTPAGSNQHLDDAEAPVWHQAILSQRLEKIDSGKAVWHDFDEAMNGLEAKYRFADN